MYANRSLIPNNNSLTGLVCGIFRNTDRRSFSKVPRSPTVAAKNKVIKTVDKKKKSSLLASMKKKGDSSSSASDGSADEVEVSESEEEEDDEEDEDSIL